LRLARSVNNYSLVAMEACLHKERVRTVKSFWQAPTGLEAAILSRIQFAGHLPLELGVGQ